MRAEHSFKVSDTERFKDNLLGLCRDFDPFTYLDSCDFYTPERMRLPLPYYHKYECLAGLGAKANLNTGDSGNFEALESFSKTNNWKFGYLSYDLKNETEKLTSANYDGIGAPLMSFFIPEIVIYLQGNLATIIADDPAICKKTEKALLQSRTEVAKEPISNNYELIRRMSRDEYICKAEKLREHIANGDIYEINFCQEHYAENVKLDPYGIFQCIRKYSPAPFAAMMQSGDIFVMSATMERFMRHQAGKMISQPIKGTIKRGQTTNEDQQLKKALQNDPKERAENVMIVDLVRNDLSKNAIPGTVQVEELFGIYPFPQVHQMISTVSSQLSPGVTPIQALKDAFPMGSMTGAPKLMAMELIEQYENTKRGIFSGSIGYIDPEGNFDFNVVIRTLIYNQLSRYLSLQVGSALTFDADPAKEWEECELKIKRLRESVVEG